MQWLWSLLEGLGKLVGVGRDPVDAFVKLTNSLDDQNDKLLKRNESLQDWKEKTEERLRNCERERRRQRKRLDRQWQEISDLKTKSAECDEDRARLHKRLETLEQNTATQ